MVEVSARESMYAYLMLGHPAVVVEEIEQRTERIIRTARQQTRCL